MKLKKISVCSHTEDDAVAPDETHSFFAKKQTRSADKDPSEAIMYSSATDAYLESRILSADPKELVHMLYVAAIKAVRDARRYLASGDIVARSNAISKASEVIGELACSLDRERGGDIANNLAALYQHILNRLTDANVQQRDEPLAEALGLLSTLSEAWAPASRKLDDDFQMACGRPPAHETDAAYGSSHSWSF